MGAVMSHASPAQQRGNTKTHKWQLKQSQLETHSALPCTHSEMWGDLIKNRTQYMAVLVENGMVITLFTHPVANSNRQPNLALNPMPPEMGAVIHVTCFSSTTATATQSHNRLQHHLYTDQLSSRMGSLLAEQLSRTGWSSPYAENPTIGS